MKYSIHETNGKKTYMVNDVHYERLEDVPQQYRHLFEDKNKDGVPDGFEFPIDMSSPLAMIRSLLAGGKPKPNRSNQEQKKNDKKDYRQGGYNRGKEEASMKPTLIKIFIVSVLTFIGFWIYQVYNSASSYTSDTEVEVIEPIVSSEDKISPQQDQREESTSDDNRDIKIYLEDPNVEPYRVFIAVKINGETLLTMNAPESMVLSDTPGNTVLEFSSDGEPGTTLSGKTLTYSVSSTPCEPDTDRYDRSSIELGGTRFIKGISDEGAAGHRYVSYAYALEKLDRCIMITLVFNLVSPANVEGALKEFDIDKEVSKLEGELARIQFQ